MSPFDFLVRFIGEGEKTMGNLSRQAFEEKYNLYSQELMNISYGYTRNKEDSLDVIQNVFYKLFNCNKSFLTPSDEKYWLIRVTINESKDLLRKRNRVTIVDRDVIDVLHEDDEKKDDRLLKLAEKVKVLPERYKSVIILHYYDSLSIKDIVNSLRISESAVKKRLERAREMLKKEMEE